MRIRNRITTLVTAGVSALLIASAPAAAAANDWEPTVTELSPELTMTQTNGSTSIHAHPRIHAYPTFAYPWLMVGQ